MLFSKEVSFIVRQTHQYLLDNKHPNFYCTTTPQTPKRGFNSLSKRLKISHN